MYCYIGRKHRIHYPREMFKMLICEQLPTKKPTFDDFIDDDDASDETNMDLGDDKHQNNDENDDKNNINNDERIEKLIMSGLIPDSQIPKIQYSVYFSFSQTKISTKIESNLPQVAKYEPLCDDDFLDDLLARLGFVCSFNYSSFLSFFI